MNLGEIVNCNQENPMQLKKPALLNNPAPAKLAEQPISASRLYIFAKHCTNNHGSFQKGDKARGAFTPELIESYLAAGILIKAPPQSAPEAEDV